MAENPNILILYPAEEEALKKFNKLKNFMQVMFPGFKAYSASAPKQEPETALEWAQVIILLIDQSYVVSPLHQALRARLAERLADNEVFVIPFFLAHSILPDDSPLKDINPAHRKPLNEEPDLDEIFSKLISRWKVELPATLANLKKAAAHPGPADAPVIAEPPLTTPDHLADSLLYLNYSDQHDALYTYREGSPNMRFNPVNLFLLRGTPECAHDLFIKSFLEIEQINVERRFINLYEFRASTENIWALVKTTLGITSRSSAPNIIGPKIVDILQNNHLVLQLENIHVDRHNYIAAINTFWQTLYQDYLLPKREELTYGLFLFVTDKACDCEYEPKQFLPPAQLSAWHRLVGILPPISKLFQDDLKDWTKKLKLLRQEAPRLISRHFEARRNQIIPNAAEGRLIIETVDAIIKECKLEQQKDRIYKKLEIWLEEEH